MQHLDIPIDQVAGFANTEKKGQSDFIYTSHEMKLNELEAKLDKLREDSDAAIFFADEKK